jgi:hypothetical protein
MRAVLYALRFTGIFHVGPKTAARNNKGKISNYVYTSSMDTDIPYFSSRYRLRNGWVQGYSDWVSRQLGGSQGDFKWLRNDIRTHTHAHAQCWRFIIAFTKTRPVSLPSARWIQSNLSLSISVTYVLILSFSTPRYSKRPLSFKGPM